MLPQILLVDDDPQGIESTERILVWAGYDVTIARNGHEALQKVRDQPEGFALILSDIRMPEMGGMEFLKALSICGDRTPVVLMTAYGNVQDAVWALKHGAVDFLTKPFKKSALLEAVEQALKRKKSIGKVLSKSDSRIELIGLGPSMQKLKDQIAKIAPSDAFVLIQGESGTGKERVARSIHEKSPRRNGPFIAVNCAAIPETLMESELFGHEKGAFTGAIQQNEGIFVAAHGGTLMLDEIGDLPLAVQVKFLRVLQEGEIRAVGSSVTKKVNVRIIAATHKDLKAAVLENRFREDLLFRLDVVGIHVPSLRDRKEDLVELSYFFLKEMCEKHQKQVVSISDDFLEALYIHDWPGNVRELSNVIERAIVFAQGPELLLEDLPDHLKHVVSEQKGAGALSGSSITVKIGTPLKEIEDLMIKKTLEAASGDKVMTAKLLGINSRTIYRRLEKNPDSDQETQ